MMGGCDMAAGATTRHCPHCLCAMPHRLEYADRWSVFSPPEYATGWLLSCAGCGFAVLAKPGDVFTPRQLRILRRVRREYRRGER